MTIKEQQLLKDFAHWMDQNEWTYIGEELWVSKNVDGFPSEEFSFKDMLKKFIRERKTV